MSNIAYTKQATYDVGVTYSAAPHLLAVQEQLPASFLPALVQFERLHGSCQLIAEAYPAYSTT